MKGIIKLFNDLIFLLTTGLFSFIPLVMILGGGMAVLSILVGWFFNKNFDLSDVWLALLCLLIILMGFKWDDATIEHYPTAIARKKNALKHQQNNKKQITNDKIICNIEEALSEIREYREELNRKGSQ